MMAAFALFFVLCSGSALACAFRYRFERILPLTVLASILVLYCAGLFDALRAGAVAVSVGAAFCWAVTFIRLVRLRAWHAFMRRFFTPAFGIYAALFIVSLIGNYGREVSAWDDLTHWADTVKQMCHLHAFGASEGGFALYPNYPPAMALMQYYAQMLNCLFTGTDFCEWLLFLAYSAALYAFLVPFMERLGCRNWFTNLCLLAAVFLLPGMLHRSQFRLLDIDPFLGVLAGYGLSLAALGRQDDGADIAAGALGAFVLTLAKESGLYFAAVICAAQLLSALIKEGAPGYRSRRFLAPGLGALLAAFGYLSWQGYLDANGAYRAFSEPARFDVLWRVLRGTEGGYRQRVLAALGPRLFAPGYPIGVAEVGVSAAALFVLLIALFLLFALLRRRKNPVRRLVCVAALGGAAALLFVPGIGIMYLFKFTEAEALALASFERYMGVPLMMLMTLLFHAGVDAMADGGPEKRRVIAVLAALLICFAPAQEAASFLLGRNRAYAANVRAQADEDAAGVFALLVGQTRKINVVSLENDGLDFLMMRFALRPNRVAGAWYIKEQRFNPEDIWENPPQSAYEWSQRLLAEGYDYVLLYQFDDAFCETFAAAFADGAAMREHTLYAVDPATGLLKEAG